MLLVHSRILPLRSGPYDEIVRFSIVLPLSTKPGVFALIYVVVPPLVRIQVVSKGPPCSSVTRQNTVTLVAFTRATSTAVPPSTVGGIVVNPLQPAKQTRTMT